MRFFSSKLMILSFLFISSLVVADNTPKLRISYGDHNAPPYAIEKGETLYGGIIKDIATEISAELDINVIFIKTPRKRIERYLENDTIHLVLISNPRWLSNSANLKWSESLFVEKDVIVIKADNDKKYQNVQDLKGMIIGTIRGFKYPTLQPFFDEGFFTRYDVSNLNVNFIRLGLNRIDALVDADISINYQLQQDKNSKTFNVLPIIVSQQNIKATLSPNAPITLSQLNQVLRKLKHQGVIAAILKKYQIEE